MTKHDRAAGPWRSHRMTRAGALPRAPRVAGRGGFTLVDALGLLVVLGLGLSVAVAALDPNREGSQQATCAGGMQAIGVGYGQYQADFNGFFPPNGDYENYPQYLPATGVGGAPPYMTRHPDAILDGPHAGPWDYTDKVARYLPNQSVWNCPAWTDKNHGWSEPIFYEAEPYHPTTYTSYLQLSVVGGPPSKRERDLPATPDQAFVMVHGSGAMLGGSGLYDNALNLSPVCARDMFIHAATATNDWAAQDDQPRIGPLGLNGTLFADLHVDYLRYWDVYQNSRGESSPGARDGKFYMQTPDPTYTGHPRPVEPNQP